MHCAQGDEGKEINLCDFNGYKSDCLVTVRRGRVVCSRMLLDTCSLSLSLLTLTIGCQCKAEHIMNERKSFILRRRFDWMKNFMANLLSLKVGCSQAPTPVRREFIK